jgi:hypothetical protein
MRPYTQPGRSIERRVLMKGKVAIVGFAMVLGLLAFAPGASAGASQRWAGRTTQDEPMDFTLVTGHGKTFIRSWDFEFIMICVESGLIIDLQTGYGGFHVPVVDGKFSFVDKNPFGYFSWSGRISPDQAKGVAKSVWPALTPKVKAEICTSGQPQWGAQPAGGGSVSRQGVRLVRELVVRHADGTITRSITGLPG